MPFQSREALAYAAGLYEGEGSTSAVFGTYRTKGVRHSRKSPQFKMAIGMTDLEPLEKFQEAVGLGVVYGPYQKNHDSWKPYYKYCVDGFERTQAVLAMLWPWLSPRRREQVQAALTAQKR